MSLKGWEIGSGDRLLVEDVGEVASDFIGLAELVDAHPPLAAWIDPGGGAGTRIVSRICLLVDASDLDHPNPRLCDVLVHG